MLNHEKKNDLTTNANKNGEFRQILCVMCLIYSQATISKYGFEFGDCFY